MEKFRGELTGLFILFAILSPFFIVMGADKANENPDVLKQENRLLNEFANKNKISIFERQENHLDFGENTVVAKGEVCYNGLINEITFKAYQNGNVEVLYLEPKKIRIESSSSAGGSLVLVGGYSSDGGKYSVIKCKDSIERIKN